MKRKHVLFVALLLTVAGLTLFAARLEPPPANVLERGGIIYSANTVFPGCVEARLKKTGALFWRRQVYVVKYDYTLEEDVQGVWITKMAFQGNDILVSNERGDQYLLDTQSLAVTPVKGPIVIDKARYKNLP